MYSTVPEYLPVGSDVAGQLVCSALRGKDSKFYVYYDADIDGVYSGLEVEWYLGQLGAVGGFYRWGINENRQHGFKLDDTALAALKGYTLIAVDFTVEPAEFDRILAAGVNLVVLDHHEIHETDYGVPAGSAVHMIYTHPDGSQSVGVILNNQYDFEPEAFRFLSGAGVVFYFLRYLAGLTGVAVPANYPALVGITLLSDVRFLECAEARFFLHQLFTSQDSYIKFLQWFLTDTSKRDSKFSPFGVPTINSAFINFSFSPTFNAMLRANHGRDVVDILRCRPMALKKYSVQGYLQSFRDVQKQIIKSATEFMESEVAQSAHLSLVLPHLKVWVFPSTFVPVDGFNLTNYIGLICSRLKDEGVSGVVLVVDPSTGMVLRGSARCARDEVDYLTLFNQYGIPAAGHAAAFGILPCQLGALDFGALDRAIEELENTSGVVTSRSVLPVSNLSLFGNSPLAKQITAYNEYSREVTHIFLKYTGDMDSVREERSSERFAKFYVDGVAVTSFDPALNPGNAFIQVSFENKDYVRYILRPAFDFTQEATLNIAGKLASLS